MYIIGKMGVRVLISRNHDLNHGSNETTLNEGVLYTWHLTIIQ